MPPSQSRVWYNESTFELRLTTLREPLTASSSLAYLLGDVLRRSLDNEVLPLRECHFLGFEHLV